MELEQKVEKYKQLTKQALDKIELLIDEKDPDYEKALDFLEMANNYYSDGNHFIEQGDLLTALAAFSYAHAWLDAGVRAKWFDAKGDDKLFVLPK